MVDFNTKRGELSERVEPEQIIVSIDLMIYM